MSFRRDHGASLKWQRWLQQNRDELLACGVPLVILEDKGNWYYFLDHGYLMPPGMAEPIIDVDSMERDKAERLCVFPEGHDCDYPNSSALNRLQHLLKRGCHGSKEVP